MKKNFIATLLFLIMSLVFITGCVRYVSPDEGYLRIHIRANSDRECDQEIKLTVRDGLVAYLTPLLRDAKNSAEAEKIILSHVSDIESATNELLYSCGYFYGCRVAVDEEYFEARRYGDLVLTEGYYRAVIVNLGSGSGHNWWCVAYPPLCFTSNDYDNVNYKSILYEVVKKYLEKEDK